MESKWNWVAVRGAVTCSVVNVLFVVFRVTVQGDISNRKLDM